MQLGPEWIIVAIVVLVLFGGAALPRFAKGLGQAQREFKKGVRGEDESKSGEKPVDKPGS